MPKSQHSPKLKWEIDPSSKCPCGSGLPFRKCCRGNEKLIEKARDFFEKGEFELAEQAWRADLTRYAGWIFKHTLPMLKHPTAPLLELVKIDVGALEELAEGLSRILEKRGKHESILHTFDHLITSVPLPGLKERMTYLKCIWTLNKYNDQEHAKQLLLEWPSHEKINDFRLLQVWFEVHADSLSLLKQIAVIDRIVSISNSPVEKLHYSIAKTMVMALVGERDEAKRFNTEALTSHLAAAAETVKSGDFYSSLICAGALEMQGMLNNEKVAFERALGFLDKVDISTLTPSGAGRLNYEKGRLYWLIGDALQATEYFTRSFESNPDVLPLIYRLDTYVQLDALAKAKQDLAKSREMGVPEAFKLEFLRSAAGLAIKSADADMARALVTELKNLKLEILNFCAQRDGLCVKLLEFAAEQSTKKITPVKRQSIWNKIRDGSEYLHLKPNIFGFGLNLNKFFERKEKDSK